MGSKQQELSFQEDEGTQYAAYEGEDGVALDNPIKRAAFALRFGDVNPLISDQLTGDSKIHYIRDIKERVSSLAPFLHYDADPYPVITDGQIQWIIDAYTTTNRYPYGESAETGTLSEGSGLDHSFNYVRNSVKAVVDAYDGTVDFYVMPVDDPIIEAYRDAFPELFSDFEDMPDDLKDHLRYPEDLFRVQTTMWGRYHVEDPGSFYEGNDYWDVARDPGTAGAGEGTEVTNSQGETVSTREARIDPYYLFTELPGDTEPEFILLRPFVPTSRGDDSQLLTAFMVGKSDRAEYGKLQVYVMPRGNLPDGPAIVQGNIQSDGAVSQQETLLSGSGSTVSFGSLTAIPIDGGLVYVRPFYVTSEQTEIPGLEQVIVYFEGEVAIRSTLEDALTAVFGESPPTLEEPPGEGEPGEEPEPEGTVTEQVTRLLTDATALFDEADLALRDGDLGLYAEKTDEARAKIAQAEALLEGEGGTSGSTTTTTTDGASACSATSGGGGPLVGFVGEIERRRVERVAEVDDRLGEGAGPALASVLGHHGRHLHSQVVDAGLQIDGHPGELGRHPGRVEPDLEQIVVRREVEGHVRAGELVESVLHAAEPIVELLGVDGQGHQRPFGAEHGQRRGRRRHRPVLAKGEAHRADGTAAPLGDGGPQVAGLLGRRYSRTSTPSRRGVEQSGSSSGS